MLQVVRGLALSSLATPGASHRGETGQTCQVCVHCKDGCGNSVQKQGPEQHHAGVLQMGLPRRHFEDEKEISLNPPEKRIRARMEMGQGVRTKEGTSLNLAYRQEGAFWGLVEVINVALT